MASVYAALLSLTKLINRTQNPPLPYAYLNKLQTQPLLDLVIFLLQFVEYFSYHTRRTREIEELENQITVAAYRAEYIIEKFVVIQIKRRKSGEGSISVDNCYVNSCKRLEKVVQEMDLITKKGLKIRTDYEEKQQQEQTKHLFEGASGSLSINAKAPPPLPPPPFGVKKNNRMMGFDDDLLHLMDKLTTNHSHRLVILIVGMGGIGKTTLATNIYNHPYIKDYFNIRSWATISQNYSFRNIVLCLLHDIEHSIETLKAFADNMRDMSDGELGLKLHKTLYGSRYLIVLDDLWSITVWNDISTFLPDNGTKSRIMMTTRLSALENSLESSDLYEMKFLNDDVSWSLLLDVVFDGSKQICPPELEEVGRIIAKRCGGLPLAIVVIGGLLKVSDKTREYWSEVAKNVSSIANKENDEQCLRILSVSYDQLPIQLKPLFLYMAIFPEDHEVKVSTLIKLWIAEALIKPPPPDISNKTLEEVARILLKDLVDRNLIIVRRQSHKGNFKTCKMHDLLRDFSLKEVKKEMFLCTKMMFDNYNESIIWDRFFSFHSTANIWDNEFSFDRMVEENSEIQPFSMISDLVRVLHVNGEQTLRLQDFLDKSNSRYLAFSVQEDTSQELILLPWNLETLLVDGNTVDVILLPSVIWEMQHLRHLNIQCGVKLCMPNSEIDHYRVLYNLQTLSGIKNFKFTNEILRRIPNIKKLGIVYDDEFIDKEDNEGEEEVLHFNLNLILLQKLETLHCSYTEISFEYRLKIQLFFPPTLTKLSLSGSRIPWENMNVVGSLPKLEVLILYLNAFCGRKWISCNEGEDQFQCLKSLTIFYTDIEIWEADIKSFPALEHLILRYCRKLEEIPRGIGEIPSLQSIQLTHCKRSAIITAKTIYDEAQGINDDLQVLVTTDNEDAELQSLATPPNFEVRFFPMPDQVLNNIDLIESYMGNFQPNYIE